MTFQEACEWLWTRQKGVLMKTSCQIAKEWPGVDPEDVFQELVLYCADLLERRFDPEKSSQVTYLINTLKFAPTHFRRRYGREVKKHERCLQIEAFLEDQLEQYEDLKDQIDEARKSKKRRDEQLRAFYQLPERTQNILKLRAEGWTYQQISTEFQITRERVRQIVNDGIRKAKEQHENREI